MQDSSGILTHFCISHNNGINNIDSVIKDQFTRNAYRQFYYI